MFKKILGLTVIVCFLGATVGPLPNAHADFVLGLPAPGAMVNLSPAYEPVIIKGLTVHKDNPFLFDFIVDIGQDKMTGVPLKKEGEKLIKYFLASLAIPDKDLWVNLSPYEKNRMVPESLGQTDMGRDLLEQDYILKQITASLIYPERKLGKTFWDKVYAKAQEMYGTTQIPVNTFNKVWITADKAEVFEHDQTAFVVASHLKVMLEEDYLALSKHEGQPPTRGHVPLTEGKGYVSPRSSYRTLAVARRLPSDEVLKAKAPQGNPLNASPTTHSMTSNIVREIVLPQLEKEINTGKNFANLRQIFNSIILSSWYKKNLKEALLNQVYADKSKVKGVIASEAKQSREQIYQQYLKAYKKGVFNYIKEDMNAAGATVPRKYFSGGMQIAPPYVEVTEDAAALAVSLPDREMEDFNVGVNSNNSLSQVPARNSDAAMVADVKVGRDGLIITIGPESLAFKPNDVYATSIIARFLGQFGIKTKWNDRDLWIEDKLVNWRVDDIQEGATNLKEGINGALAAMPQVTKTYTALDIVEKALKVGIEAYQTVSTEDRVGRRKLGEELIELLWIFKAINYTYDNPYIEKVLHILLPEDQIGRMIQDYKGPEVMRVNLLRDGHRIIKIILTTSSLGQKILVPPYKTTATIKRLIEENPGLGPEEVARLILASGFRVRGDIEDITPPSYATNSLDLLQVLVHHSPLDILVLGNDNLDTFRLALRIHALGLGDRIVITGGHGRLTEPLRQKAKAAGYQIPTDENVSEAEIIRKIMVQMIYHEEQFRVLRGKDHIKLFLLLETSTNTPENLEEYKSILPKGEASSVILIQTPHQQLRAMGTFKVVFNAENAAGNMKVWSVTVPYNNQGRNEYEVEKELIAEAWRLIIYTLKGDVDLTSVFPDGLDGMPDEFWQSTVKLFESLPKIQQAALAAQLIDLAKGLEIGSKTQHLKSPIRVLVDKIMAINRPVERRTSLPANHPQFLAQLKQNRWPYGLFSLHSTVVNRRYTIEGQLLNGTEKLVRLGLNHFLLLQKSQEGTLFVQRYTHKERPTQKLDASDLKVRGNVLSIPMGERKTLELEGWKEKPFFIEVEPTAAGFRLQLDKDIKSIYGQYKSFFDDGPLVEPSVYFDYFPFDLDHLAEGQEFTIYVGDIKQYEYDEELGYTPKPYVAIVSYTFKRNGKGEIVCTHQYVERDPNGNGWVDAEVNIIKNRVYLGGFWRYGIHSITVSDNYQELLERLKSGSSSGGDAHSIGFYSTNDEAALAQPPGGIDLATSSGMQWKVAKDGKGVEMNIDQAMIERVRREGVDSLSAVVFSITPITSIWPLMGIQAPVKGHL